MLSYLSFIYLKLFYVQGSDHKEFSSMLHKALEGAVMLESFPKTTVDVFALVLESGGSKFTLAYFYTSNKPRHLMTFRQQ